MRFTKSSVPNVSKRPVSAIEKARESIQGPDTREKANHNRSAAQIAELVVFKE